MLPDSTTEKLVVATSTISDGNMSFLYSDHEEVIENRRKFLGAHGLSLEDTVVMSAVHGNNHLVVDENDRGKGAYTGANAPDVDALIAHSSDLALFLLTADCLPISFYDPGTQTLALAHLGWKPTDLQLSTKVLTYILSLENSDPGEICVHIGPGIKKESYTVIDPAQATSPEWQPYIELRPDGSTSIDLVAYNIAQIIGGGILPKNITIDQTDTVTDQRYYSHRRSKELDEPQGRIATVVCRRS